MAISVSTIALFRHVLSAELDAGRPVGVQHLLQTFEPQQVALGCAAAAVALELGVPESDPVFRRFRELDLWNQVCAVELPTGSADITRTLAARAALVAHRATVIAADKAIRRALDEAEDNDCENPYEDPAVIAATDARDAATKKSRALRTAFEAAMELEGIPVGAIHIYDGAGDIV